MAKSSSNIAGVKYDEPSKVLSVTFHSGGTYSYENVTPAEFHAFHTAESLGKHFHKNIKSKVGRRVDVQGK